jgi:hypothetical protein
MQREEKGLTFPPSTIGRVDLKALLLKVSGKLRPQPCQDSSVPGVDLNYLIYKYLRNESTLDIFRKEKKYFALSELCKRFGDEQLFRKSKFLTIKWD